MCEYFPDSCGNCQPCVNQCPSDINICPQYPIPVCYCDPDDYIGSIGNPTNDSSASLLGQEDDTPKCTRFLKVSNPIYNNANKPKPFSQQGSFRAGNRNSTGSGSGGPSRARSGKTPGRTSTGKASLSSGGGGVGKSRKKLSRASRSRRSPKPLSLGKSTNRSARNKNKSRDKSLKGGKGSGKAKSRGRSGKSKRSSSRATSKGKSRSKSKNSKERGRSSRRTGKLKPRGPPPTPVIDENKRRLQLLDLLERFNKYILETGIGSDDNTKVNLLRGYSSEPDVQLPCKTKFSFKGKKPRGKTAVQVSKSMDDVLLEKKGYLHLLNPNPYSDEDFKEINISSQTWKKWHDYFDLENKRYSFFDELFFKKYVTDSMEVPGKSDDISYLIEADSADYRSKIDYGRVVLKTKHVYTGNFVDWYFQGPGRYVWLDGSVYQGDFVNGVMHGEGTLLWPNGSIYEGEFRHGVRGGSGVYTTSAGYVYSGEWLQGLPQGKGKLWYDPVGNPDNFYEGNLVKGLPHGFGTRNYGSGDSYIGNWSNGQRDGHGTMLWRGQKQMYKGKWHKGHVHGKGIHAWFSSKPEQEPVPEPPRTPSSKKHKHKQKQQPPPQPQAPQPTVFRHIFQGRWKKGARHGIGRLYYPNGSVYEGTWELGKQVGEGSLQDPTGELLTGLQCSHAESTGFIENILDRTTCECLFSRLLTAVYKRVPLKLCENRRKDERELTNFCFDNMYQFKLLYQRAVDLGKMWSNFTPSSKTTHPSKRNPKCFQPARNYLSEFGNEHSMFSKFNNMETQNRDQIATRFGLWLLIKDMKNVGKQICLSTLDESWAAMPSIGFQTLHSPFETVYFWQFVQCIVVLAFEFLVALPFEKSRAKYKCKREKDETEVDGAKSAVKIKKKRGGSSRRSRGTSKNSGGSGSNGKSKKATTNISKKTPVPDTANPKENPPLFLKTPSKSTPKSVLQVNLSDDDFIDVPNAAEDGMIGRHPSELIPTDEQAETDTDDVLRQDSSEEDIYEAFPSCGDSICMGDLFKTFMIFELTPCFTNVAGKYLPQLPNSLPPIKDLFEMFRSVKNHDVITALDFLYIILPHRIFPDSHRDAIYWNRISEILSPKVDYDSIFRFVKEMESWEGSKPIQKPPRKQHRNGGNGDDNYNEDYWTESAEEFDNTNSNNIKNFNNNVKLDFNNNQKPLTEITELNDTSEEGDSIKYCQPSKPKTVQTQVEEISRGSAASEENPPGYKIYDEDGFPFIEFELMTPDSAPSSSEIPSDRIQLEKPRSLRNLGADDVVGVFRYMYPGLCGQPTETNLHFQMLFCDWLWCIILCTQVSIEKERLREGRVKSNEFHVSSTKNSVHNKNIEKLRCCQSKKLKGDALLQDHILNLFYKHQDLRRGEKWVSDNQSTNFQTVKSGNVGKNLASREEEPEQGENAAGLKSSHEA